MIQKSTIEKTIKKVSFNETEDDEQLEYWENLSIKERLQAVKEWNEKVWRFLLKENYPESMERTGSKQIKALTDEDDF